MSAKVCLPAWNGGPQKTRDATTLGQLQQMIRSLYGLGYDVDTPVTYLFDEDHVWLETVEWDVEEVFSKVAVPRVVEALGEDEKGAQWVDCDRGHWRWVQDEMCWGFTDRDSSGIRFPSDPTAEWGPYVEVIA